MPATPKREREGTRSMGARLNPETWSLAFDPLVLDAGLRTGAPGAGATLPVLCCHRGSSCCCEAAEAGALRLNDSS